MSLLLGAIGLISAGCGGSTGGAGGSTGATSATTGSTGSTSSGGGGDCFDYSTFDGTTPVQHFSTDVLPIWRQSCGLSTSCHGDPNLNSSNGGLYLGPPMSQPAPSTAEIAAILAMVVGQPAIDEPDMSIIKASDPKNSFMMYKLDGDPTNLVSGVDCSTLACAKASTNTCLTAMPSGGPQLSSDERNIIRRWIAQGAKND